LQPERARNKAFIEELTGYSADLFVVASYGQILSERLLNLPKHGCINVHASLLPKYRGASPIQAAIVNGDGVSGVTIMQMDKGIDTGDILHVVETPIFPDDTAQTLHDRLAELGADALLEALGKLERGELKAKKQDGALATHVGMLTKDDGRIDWNKTPRQVVDLVRGFNPWPGAFAALEGSMLKVWKAEAVGMEMPPNAACGEVLAADSRGLIICANGGAVRLCEIQSPGSKRMADTEFLKGRRILANKE